MKAVAYGVVFIGMSLMALGFIGCASTPDGRVALLSMLSSGMFLSAGISLHMERKVT